LQEEILAEEKKEPWLNYLALTTVILAVCATLSTFKGGSYSTRSVLSQSQAANQWAFYQAKSIKSYLYEVQKEKLELELKGIGAGTSKSLVKAYEQKVRFMIKISRDIMKKKAKYKKEPRSSRISLQMPKSMLRSLGSQLFSSRSPSSSPRLPPC
jgi:hypothetical protein